MRDTLGFEKLKDTLERNKMVWTYDENDGTNTIKKVTYVNMKRRFNFPGPDRRITGRQNLETRRAS